MTRLLVEIRERLSNSRFLRGVVVLAGGTALGQVVVLAVSPFITRLYTPEDFGYLALYASALSILVVVASLRYHVAIPLPADEEDALSLVATSFGALFAVTVVVAVAIAGVGRPLLSLVNAAPMLDVIWLLPVGLFGAGTYQVLSYWAIRTNAHRRLASTKLAQGVGLAVSQLAFGILSMGPVGLIMGDVIGRVAGSGTLARLTARPGLWRGVTAARMKRNVLRYRRFPLLSGPSALLNSGGLQVPSLLLLAFYGPQIAGWFALSQRVIGIPMALLGTSVSQVYTGRAAEVARAAPAELRGLFVRTSMRLLLIAVLPAAILAFTAPWLFSVVFGTAWLRAGEYTRILAPMFLLQFAVAPLSQTLNILERQELQLVWDATRFVLAAGSLWIGNVLELTDMQAMTVFGASMALAYVALYGLSLVALRRRSPSAS